VRYFLFILGIISSVGAGVAVADAIFACTYPMSLKIAGICWVLLVSILVMLIAAIPLSTNSYWSNLGYMLTYSFLITSVSLVINMGVHVIVFATHGRLEVGGIFLLGVSCCLFVALRTFVVKLNRSRKSEEGNAVGKDRLN
jgi:hypothetical protein